MKTRWAFETREIAIRDLTIDHSYQRDLVNSRVRAIAEDLDLDRLGTLTISQRSNGALVVVDGQHRVEAVRFHGLDEWEVTCRVYVDLTREQEAELYRHLNNTRRITAWDDFKAGLVAGDDECRDIARIARATGWEVASSAGDGKVCCVSTLRSLYRREGGAAALKAALHDAREAWGDNAIGVEKGVLGGLTLLHLSCNGELDRPALIRKLAKAKGGPAGILGTARQLAELRRQPLARLCAAVIAEHYNRGRRAGQIVEFA